MMYPYSKRLLASIRDYQAHANRRGVRHKILRKYASCRHLFWTVVTASDINRHMRFGKDLTLPHPTGVVIHEDTVIGDNCMIMQQVTLGMTADNAAPHIGNNVYVGAGAKILGGVRIGDGARIGAQAVVISDVPAHSTAVGIPARIIRRSPNAANNSSEANAPLS